MEHTKMLNTPVPLFNRLFKMVSMINRMAKMLDTPVPLFNRLFKMVSMINRMGFLPLEGRQY
jgi:hypothetical protein